MLIPATAASIHPTRKAMESEIMTYQEIVKTIQTLPLAERLSLLEVLAHSLHVDIESEKKRTSSLERVRGLLKVDSPPSSQEIEDDYTDYLIEKYA